MDKFILVNNEASRFFLFILKWYARVNIFKVMIVMDINSY